MTKAGPSEAQCVAVARNAGYPVDDPRAPIFHDQPLRHNDRLSMKNLPELSRVTLGIPNGGRLGVPSLGQFGRDDIWYEAAAAFARKGVVVHDCLTGTLLDVQADPGAAPEGAKLVLQQAGETRTAAARAARSQSAKGRSKGLTGDRLHLAMIEWGADDNRSAAQVAEELGVGIATMYREMVNEAGRPVGRIAAIALAKQGLWPPARRSRG